MRILLILLLAAPVYGQTRTWTITTNVGAELVAVRGGDVFLRIGDAVRPVPIAWLSEADQRYVASIPLAPVVPGPASDGADDQRLPMPPVEAAQYLAPGPNYSVAAPFSSTRPPATTGERSLLESGPQYAAGSQTNQAGTLPLPPSARPTAQRPPQPQVRDTRNQYDRRNVQPTRQRQAAPSANSRDPQDERRRDRLRRRDRRRRN